MNDFFHWDTKRFDRARDLTLRLTLLPLGLICVILNIILVMNLRVFGDDDVVLLLALGSFLAVAIGVAVMFVAFYSTYRLIPRYARFTYVQIGTGQAVFSKYIGRRQGKGKREFYRKLWVVDFQNLEQVTTQDNGKHIIIRTKDGGIREYTDAAERLKYYFVERELLFDDWWYNNNCFEQRDELVVTNGYLGGNVLAQTLLEAKARFDALPKRTPYVHKELDFVRRKKAIERFNRNKY